jgi:hypothetical protein
MMVDAVHQGYIAYNTRKLTLKVGNSGARSCRRLGRTIRSLRQKYFYVEITFMWRILNTHHVENSHLCGE